MASAKKIIFGTAIVLGVAGVIYLGANDWPEFARMKKVKELYKLPERMDNIDKRVDVVEHQVDTLAAWDEYFDYTLDSIGGVADSALDVATHADSLADVANRKADAAGRKAKQAQAAADSARADAKRALDCCNGSNNGNAGDTAVAVKTVKKPGHSAKPNKPVKKPGSSVKPSRPAQYGNGQSQSQTVIVNVNGNGVSVNQNTPTARQRTTVVINGVTYSDVEEVSRELNANVQIVMDTVRQRIY